MGYQEAKEKDCIGVEGLIIVRLISGTSLNEILINPFQSNPKAP